MAGKQQERYVAGQGNFKREKNNVKQLNNSKFKEVGRS